MARKKVLFKMDNDDNRYSIIPMPRDTKLSMRFSEKINGLIDMMIPKPSSPPVCSRHPERTVTFNCKSCNNKLICDECHTNDHEGHVLEDIKTTYHILQNHLQTAKRNMDKINERCLIFNDENQNEENQIRTLFEKMEAEHKSKQDAIAKSLRENEAQLVQHEQVEIKTIEYSKEADQRLYEVEAIEAMAALDNRIEALQKEKQQVEEKLTAKLKEREEASLREINELRKGLDQKRNQIKERKDKVEMNAKLFFKVYEGLKFVSESHANACRETITDFLEKYKEVSFKVSEVGNGSASVELLQGLSKLMEGSESSMSNISNDSFVLGVPQVRYEAADNDYDLGHFLLYPGEQELFTFTWGRACQKGWYIENISGLSNQLIAVVSRRRGSKESYIDILTHKGDQLTSHKVTIKTVDTYRFVCAVSPYRVATCCENDICLINIDNGTVEASYKLCKGEEAWQIAYNRIKNEILIGIIGSNELRVFDDQLRPIRIIMMQQTNRAPLSLAANGSNIFICTYENRAFVLDGEKGTICTTFHRNGLENRAWRICCDSLGMVYVMWLRATGVVRISRYDVAGNPISSLDVDCSIKFLSFALIQNGSEQLIVSSEEGNFFIYRTPSRIEDAMLRAVDDIGLSKTIRVMSVWKPI